MGMEKQAKYDQGVQKIQGQIDNIAGIDVLRPVDKANLQSKLNQLGSDLRKVAASDFSNFQLVNSVGGMATQIVKDPTVQAAISSTANDKKQLSEMDADEKSGKLTPHARYYYELKRNAYLNNPDLTSKEGKPINFSGQYTRSWDLDKELLNAVDKVGEGKFKAQQPFKTDPNTGKILYNTRKVKDSKGNIIEVNDGPVLSEYAVEEIKSGKFSENITAAINLVLSRPEAQQELTMRGVYDYRGYDDVNDFIAEYDKEKNTGIITLENKKLELLSKANLETDPERKKQFQEMITKTEDDIKTLANYEDPRVKEAQQFKDLDSYKALVYGQRIKNLYGKAFTRENYERTYVASAPYNAYRQKIKDERDWWATQDDSRRDWANYAISKETLNLAKAKWRYDPTNPEAPGNQAMPYEKGALPGELYNNWIKEGTQAIDDYDMSKKKFVVDYMIAVNHANGSTKTDEEITRDADNYEKNSPGFFERQYELDKDIVSKNPTNLTFSNLISSLPVLTSLEKKVGEYARQTDEINNNPEVLKAGSGNIKDLEKRFKPVTIQVRTSLNPFAESQSITLDAEDQMNVAIFNSAPQKVLRDKASAALLSKHGVSADKIAQSTLAFASSPKSSNLPTITSSQGAAADAQRRLAYENVKEYSSLLGGKVVVAKEEILKRRMKGNSPVAFELYPSDADTKTKNSVNERLKTVLGDKATAGSTSKFADFYSGPEASRSKYNVNVGVNRGGALGGQPTLTLDLYDQTGLIESVPIRKEDADYIKQTSLVIPEAVSDVVRKVQWGENKLSTNSITADPNNPNAYKGAHYPSEEFHYLENPNIMGADIKINNLGKANVYFYIKDKEGNIKGVPVKESPKAILPVMFNSIDAGEKFIKGIQRPSEIANILKNANISIK